MFHIIYSKQLKLLFVLTLHFDVNVLYVHVGGSELPCLGRITMMIDFDVKLYNES